jgi:hypothetical protein
MARSLTTAVRNALAANHVIACHLVRLDLDTGALRFATAGHDVYWDSATWTGAGSLGSIEAISEGLALEARGVRLSLSGIPTALVSAALSEPVQGRRLRIWLAAFDPETHAILADPVLEWDGRIDTLTIIDGASQ